MAAFKTRRTKAIDLPTMAGHASKASFRPHEGYFVLSLSERGSGAKSSLVVRAIVSAAGEGRDEPKPMLVRMPARIKQRLEGETGRSASVAVAALVEWALDQLAERRQVLTVDNKD